MPSVPSTPPSSASHTEVNGSIAEEEKTPNTAKPSEERAVTAQDWTGPEDPECPINWPLKKRLYLSSVPTLYCFSVTFASSVYTSGSEDVQQRFGVGPTTALLGLSVFVWGLAFGPLIAAPLSENYGRKIVYLSTFPIFGLFTLGAGLAQNFATIVICRFLAGVFGSPALAVAGGTMADMWPAKMTGQTFPWVLAAPFFGPTLGPVVGGFVAAKKDFRWLQWVILFNIAGIYLYSLPMPESYKKTILQRRAKHLNIDPPPSTTPKDFKPALKHFFFATIMKPIKILFGEAIVLSLTIYISFNFAIIYSFFAAFPYVFKTTYQFTGPQIGLTFLSLGLGVFLGFLACLLIDKLTYPKLLDRYNGKVPPEYRLLPAMFGAPLLPISLFWFGWTASTSNHVSWPVPVVGAIPFGMGNLMVYSAGGAYFLDAYGMANGASALSANGLMRYIAGGAFPLFARQMYQGLGIGWASSLWGFVACALVPMPFVFFKYGARIRKGSKFIPED